MNSNIEFCKNIYKNPIITSSGTHGNGYEFNQFYNTSDLGGITLKALTVNPKKGNPDNRVCETEAGLLNSIGLQNNGLEYFQTCLYPKIQQEINTHTHVNISGETESEYLKLIETLNELEHITAIELNVSCPNTKNNQIIFGSDPNMLSSLVKKCVKIKKKPLIVKLSPNVKSISSMAKICEDSGADAVSLVNTFLGMKINIKTQKPYIHNNIAGYSGTGIKPIAIRMVYETAKVVKIPIIGIGGVFNYEDVIEFMLAGASLVAVGTANLLYPKASLVILKDFLKYLKKKNMNAEDLIGAVHIN